MRTDMKKLIVTRPRHQHKDGNAYGSDFYLCKKTAKSASKKDLRSLPPSLYNRSAEHEC
jgi:hypothetical protein